MSRGRGAAGAVVAQFAQALTSFVLHVLAARQIGPEGLGIFALCYSGIVLSTAVSTGLVGDSLTVLARHLAPIRAGLQVVGVGVAATAGVGATVAAAATGLLSGGQAVILGAVVVVFTIEDLARRLLMASLRFWSVVVTDAVALLVTLAWLGAAAMTGSGLELADLLRALLAGQLGGLATAVALLPSGERWLAAWSAPAVSEVVRFGSWRAAQQAVRPATLIAVRSIAIVAAGAATFGALEAARVFVAPALLLVNGVSSFLFSSYASQRTHSRRSLLRRADVSAAFLSTSILAFGGVALVLLPFAGGLVTGGTFEIEGIAVFGWVVYAACSAFLTPYGGLAAVSGAQAKVFGVRVAEAVASVLLVAVVVLGLAAPLGWVPYALGPAALVAGLVIRQLLLVRGHDLDRPLGAP